MSPSAISPASPRNGAAALTTGIFGQLIDEWSRLCVLPSLSRQLHRWGSTEIALGGIETLQDVITRLDEGDRAEDDRLLAALVRLAHSGQVMAGRIVLQAMLPKLVKISRTTGSTSSETQSREDRCHVIVATFWTVMAGYPIHRRTTKVAAGLALDTLHELTRDLRRPTRDIPVDPLEASDRFAVLTAVDPTATVGGLSSDADLLEVIAWGVDVDVISGEDAAVLTRVYVPDPGIRTADVAAAMGLTTEALRQRCSRARRRLIEAVRADTNGLRASVILASVS